MFSTAPAILLIGNDPTEQHPLLAWQIRNNVRLHRAKLYVLNSQSIKLRRQATQFQANSGWEPRKGCEFSWRAMMRRWRLSAALSRTSMAGLGCAINCEVSRTWSLSLGRRFAETIWRSLVSFGAGISGAKFVCLADYCEFARRGRYGALSGFASGLSPVAGNSEFHQEWGTCRSRRDSISGMVEARKSGALKALYVVGSNPVGRLEIDPFAFSNSFVVVQDMFLTETAVMADVVLPAANAYEKSGTLTNTCGDFSW